MRLRLDGDRTEITMATVTVKSIAKKIKVVVVVLMVQFTVCVVGERGTRRAIFVYLFSDSLHVPSYSLFLIRY